LAYYDWNPREAHEIVFENKPLCDFLMRGNLEHFLAQVAPPATPTMPHEVDSDILEAIGPSFARQYDSVLAKAIEQGDVEAVECLFDGRRWVSPANEERCFESARRVLGRLQEPLVRVGAVRARQRTVGLDEIKQVLGKGNLDRIMTLLPVEFYNAHAVLCGALRDLSVQLYNSQSDAEAAKAVLDLGKVSASRSPELAHQLSEDVKTLDEKLAQEKKYEVYLTVGGVPLYALVCLLLYQGLRRGE
jgi:hypothetical protein